jgi:serine/threonine protein kinase
MDDSELRDTDLQKLLTKDSKNEFSNYKALQVIGSGSFGVVYQARCLDNNEIVAIKKVFQDRRYKNRELQILKELNHNNVIKIKHYFYTPGAKSDDTYLNVVMDFVPTTVGKAVRENKKSKKELPPILVKLYAYQMLRAINYIHALGICHRDIKPQNILLDDTNHILKLCDFGSAKKLISEESNVAYICSRYYRAPELIFGATEYNFSVDVWSTGCVIAELVLNEPLFPGDTSIDQIVEIIKLLGTPTRKQINEMNPDYKSYKFPFIKSYTYEEVFNGRTNVDKVFFDLLRKMLCYDPKNRITPLKAMLHPFFDELRYRDAALPDGSALPTEIFDFSIEEITQDKKGVIKQLIPEWFKKSFVSTRGHL